VAAEALHDDGFGQNRDIDRGAVLARGRLVDSPRHGTLALLGSGYFAKFALPGTRREEDVNAGRTGFYDSYDRAARGRSVRGFTALAHEWHSDGQKLHTTAYAGYRRLELLENYTGFLVDPVNGDRRSQTQDTWSFGATVIHDSRITDRLTLHTGLGVRGDVIEQRQEHVDQGEAVLESERSLNGLQALFHALAGLGWRPLDPLRLVAGARADFAEVSMRDGLDGDRMNTGTLAALSPRVTAEWHALSSLRLFAAYGRGFRPPEARAFTSFEPEVTGIAEDVYDGGDPEMTVSDSFELGARWNHSRHFGARLSSFATLIERESVFDHVSGINLELNGTRRLGAEFDIHSKPLSFLTLGADVAYVDARFVDSGKPVPLAPRLVGGARAILTHPGGFRAGLRFFALAPRPLPHGAHGATFGMLDATAGYDWRWLRLDLKLENVLNQRLREGEYHYASHWSPDEEPSQIPVVHYVAGPPLNARLSVSAVF
jgi:outer membrane receptor protein involved in Fe transport